MSFTSGAAFLRACSVASFGLTNVPSGPLQNTFPRSPEGTPFDFHGTCYAGRECSRQRPTSLTKSWRFVCSTGTSGRPDPTEEGGGATRRGRRFFRSTEPLLALRFRKREDFEIVEAIRDSPPPAGKVQEPNRTELGLSRRSGRRTGKGPDQGKITLHDRDDQPAASVEHFRPKSQGESAAPI